jgi:ABC-2 type transport system ATP-binding protein
VESPTAIQIDHLSKTYRQRNGEPIHAVKNVSLTVLSGQVYGFLGPNGAGKTTTIKMICGLVRPTSGNVQVNKLDVWRKRGAAMRHIGVVLEGTRNVHWPLSAWDNLIYFGHLKGLRGKTLATRAEHLLRKFDLWDRRGDLVRTFSRGMQQKVAVACALVADPPIVLLDEPTLGLDVQAARAVKRLVEQLVRESGKTVVLTTHQLDMAQELCDHVAIISKGRIIADQPVAELLDLFSREHYQIRVEGRLSTDDALRFDGMMAEEKEGNTVLSGPITDRSALYDILNRLRDLDLALLSVHRSEPDLEEVFVRLVDTGTERQGVRK